MYGQMNVKLMYLLDADSVQQIHVQQPFTYAKPEAASTVLSFWWWAVCRPKHVELYINMKYNFDTLLHLVGFFYVNYTMMHGFTNIKFSVPYYMFRPT
jgi:hypothetical protein